MSDKVDQKTEKALLHALENAKAYTQKLREGRDKRLWQPVDVPCSLFDALCRLTKDKLDEIRRTYQIKGLSALKKAELASELSRGIPIVFHNVLNTLDQGRYDLIKGIASHSGMVADCGLSDSKIETLMKHSILFPGSYENKKVLFMPHELISIFEESDGDALQQVVRRNTEWIQLTHGLLHYFGVMDTGRIMDKLERLTGHSVGIHDFLSVMTFACDFYGQASLTATGMRDCRAFDAAKIIEAYLMRPDVEDYPFTIKQLMKAADPGYVVRSPQMNRLIQLLLDYYQLPKGEIDELVLQISAIIQSDASPTKVIQFLQMRMEFPSFDFVQQLLAEVTEVYNHTRQWVLKGHTPHELFQKEKEHLIPLPDQPLAPVRSQLPTTSNSVTHAKIGRNDPCPCGSGKKYKKCCGK
ncbi:MAG: SEC-C metal-binding domain-containing protein [Sporolactobacillus sp.]